MGVVFAGFDCIFPPHLADYCLAHDLPTTAWLGKANRFLCPLGPVPGFGQLLMDRYSIDRLDFNARQDLIFNSDGTHPVTLKSLQVVTATCITPGERGDRESAYLVKIADRRRAALGVAIDKAYNLRNAGDSAGAFLTGTGGGWTWDSMIQDIWATIGSFGGYPGLPFSPDGSPEGFDFYGRRALPALALVLARIGCAMKLDPIADVFSIVQLGAADTYADAALSARDDSRVFDGDYFEGNLSLVPESARVLFPKDRNVPDGTGESPWYVIDVPGGVAGSEPGSVVILQDDLAARYSPTGSLINLAALTTRAMEQATDYFRKARQTRLHRSYGYTLADTGFRPGAQVKATLWADYGQGMVTEVGRFPGLLIEDDDPAGSFDNEEDTWRFKPPPPSLLAVAPLRAIPTPTGHVLGLETAGLVGPPGPASSVTVRADDGSVVIPNVSDLAFHVPSNIVSSPGPGLALIKDGWQDSASGISQVAENPLPGTSELHAHADHVHQAKLTVHDDSTDLGHPSVSVPVVTDETFHYPTFLVIRTAANQAKVEGGFGSTGDIQPVGTINDAGTSERLSRVDHKHRSTSQVTQCSPGYTQRTHAGTNCQNTPERFPGGVLGGPNDVHFHRQCGVSPFDRWYSGELAGPPTVVSVSPSTGTLYAVAFRAPADGHLSAIECVVNGGVGTIRLGVYKANSAGSSGIGNHYPSLLLVDSGEISGTGRQQKTINVALSYGELYWFVFLCSSPVTAQGLTAQSFHPIFGWDPLLSAVGGPISVAQAYGPLPVTFPDGAAILAATSNVPLVAVKFCCADTAYTLRTFNDPCAAIGPPMCASLWLDGFSGYAESEDYSVSLHTPGVDATSITPTGDHARAISVRLWLLETGRDMTIFSYGDDSGFGEINFMVRADGTVGVCIDKGVCSGVFTAVADALAAGQWYHLVFSYAGSGANCKIYINDVLKANSPFGVPLSTGRPDPFLRVWGMRYDGAAGGPPATTDSSQFLHGYLRDGRLYNTDLSAADVTTIFNSGCPADDTTTPINRWKFNDGTGRVAADSVGSQDAQLVNGADWILTEPCCGGEVMLNCCPHNLPAGLHATFNNGGPCAPCFVDGTSVPLAWNSTAFKLGQPDLGAYEYLGGLSGCPNQSGSFTGCHFLFACNFVTYTGVDPGGSGSFQHYSGPLFQYVVEFSPDGGNNWYEPILSPSCDPVSFQYGAVQIAADCFALSCPLNVHVTV